MSAQFWLQRVDPRAKLLVAVTVTVLLFAWNNVFLLGLALAVIVAALLTSGVSRDSLVGLARLIAPVALTIIVVWPLFYRVGPVWFHLLGLPITGFAVVQGMATAMRLMALAFVTGGVALTTTSRAFLRGLVRLGVPYDIALSTTIGLGNVPRIRRTYDQVTDAQRARGFDLEAGGFVRRARARIPVLVATLVSTFRTAETLTRSLECRGFGRPGLRTSLFEVHWTARDTALVVVVTIVVLALVWLRLRWGFGAHPLYCWP